MFKPSHAAAQVSNPPLGVSAHDAIALGSRRVNGHGRFRLSVNMLGFHIPHIELDQNVRIGDQQGPREQMGGTLDAATGSTDLIFKDPIYL